MKRSPMKPILITHALILSLSISEISKASVNLENSQDIQTIDQVSDILQIQDSGTPDGVLNSSLLGLIPRISSITPCDGGFCFPASEAVPVGERVMIYESSHCIWAATGKVVGAGRIALDKQNTNMAPQNGDLALIMSSDAEITIPIPCSYRS